MGVQVDSDLMQEILDVVGIGFGPSNLALAIALTEHNEQGGALTARFLERKPEFGWHQGMLLEGATMQVSFLKDLATLRNPVSQFGFLSYLHARSRLVDFINHKSFFPSRVEFHDYLQWCADQLSPLVEYGTEAVTARPVYEAGMVTHYEVTARCVATGRTTALLARNIVVAPGLSPELPAGITAGERIWHSSEFLGRVSGITDPRRLMVVGAGQSAAEIVDHLHRTFPSAEVYAVFARYGYSQADDSPFANRIFDPAAIDDFHAATEESKSALLAYHSNTNYAVVDVDLIEDLYARTYDEKVRGVNRLRLLNMSRLKSAHPSSDGVEVTIWHENTASESRVEVDALVCATGYRETDPATLLGEVEPLLWRDAQDRLRVERDYRVATGPEVLAGVYLCGGTEHSHGITSSLLSSAAVRAGEIVRSIVTRVETPAAPLRASAGTS